MSTEDDCERDRLNQIEGHRHWKPPGRQESSDGGAGEGLLFYLLIIAGIIQIMIHYSVSEIISFIFWAFIYFYAVLIYIFYEFFIAIGFVIWNYIIIPLWNNI